MGVPTGEVVARPMVARACGCLREFQHYAADKYRAQRLAKFQSTRCEVCAAKLAEEQRLAAVAACVAAPAGVTFIPFPGRGLARRPAAGRCCVVRAIATQHGPARAVP